ncbi:ornithine cyclodeaminase family protein [Kineosporia babensis]|uniref:Ornithine cyclodeaminase n=1 Tax=Kineosporia babensis TaxID=499548 RepID=A0A9X1NDQ5_9ACTN|nr:hypothetical protein [Kineosporia babensis]MCD5311895.1 hypothetical protein [Kineosporia babensis]
MITTVGHPEPHRSSVPHLSAAEVFAACGYREAVDALRTAMSTPTNALADPARQFVPVENGVMLLMPASRGSALGVKVLTVADPGLDQAPARIQGLYLMFDGTTMSPSAILDGPAITTLRTPAVSVAAVLDALPQRPLRVAVYGHGPQAVGHAECLAAVRDVASVRYLVRRPVTVAALGDADVAAIGLDEAEKAVREADVVVCATTASEPLFPADWIKDDAVVIAVGSHDPDGRELEADLLGRAHVIVESRETALREAGDVIMAIAEQALTADDLIPMADVVTGRARPSGKPVVFKSVGMAWQDLVVAGAVLRGASAEPAGQS